MPMRSVYKKEIHPLCKENPNRPPKKTLLPYDTDQAEFNFTHYEMKSMLHPDNLEQALLTHLKKKEDSGHKKIGGSMTLRKSDKFYIMESIYVSNKNKNTNYTRYWLLEPIKRDD